MRISIRPCGGSCLTSGDHRSDRRLTGIEWWREKPHLRNARNDVSLHGVISLLSQNIVGNQSACEEPVQWRREQTNLRARPRRDQHNPLGQDAAVAGTERYPARTGGDSSCEKPIGDSDGPPLGYETRLHYVAISTSPMCANRYSSAAFGCASKHIPSTHGYFQQ